MKCAVQVLEYATMLEAHDWFFEYSSEPAERLNGHLRESELQTLSDLSLIHKHLWYEFTERRRLHIQGLLYG